MCPMKNWLFRYLAPAIAVLGAAIGWNSPSYAYVTQIVIDQTATVNYSPIPLGSSTPGPAVSYTIYQGRIFGTLNPNNPLNAVITDINSAAPVSGGNNYIANFQIVTPTSPAARNGLIIDEVPNRGGNAISTTSLIAGATYVQSGWQGDLLAQCVPVTPVATPYPACFDLSSGPYGSLNTTTGAFTAPTVTNVNGTATLSAYVVQVPVATTDGNPPNGTNTITGFEYSHICTGTNGCGLAVGSAPTSTAELQVQAGFPPSAPASLDTSQAQFWSVTSQNQNGVDSAQTPITNWTFAYCPNGPSGAGYTPNPRWICLGSGTFNPNLMYEMVYTAANPLVLGVGFAAYRDLASFLRFGTTAPGGGTNPIAGTITKAYTVGSSQSGAMIHGFIFYGFNEDEDGRIVFDGAWPQIDGRMMVANVRWGQPENLMYLYMGGDEAPVWWADYPNLARGLPADGMLHRCTASGTCPQVLETFGSAEMYSEKMSVSLCGFTCVADIPLPSNVYRYYSPGATHGGGTVSFNWNAPGVTETSGQQAPSSPIPETYTNNALQYAFIELILNGTPMPPSAVCVTYPGVGCPSGPGQLVSAATAASVGFPAIPTAPYAAVNAPTYGGNQAWPPFVYNFGPGENYDQQSGIPTIQPPQITQVLPVYAPKGNADGNDSAYGIPSVLEQAPLATYVGWNLATTGWYGPNASNGPGSVGQVFAGAGNSGAYYPFYQTAAQRTAAGDPRLSLEERYGTNLGYKCVARQAVNRALEQRFLLASDAQTLISDVAASNVLASPFTPTMADTSLANTFCDLSDAHDFNGDGMSDIGWRDTSGDNAIWLMNGSTVSFSAGLGTIAAAWSIVGQRDFNGDGTADLLWHDTSGDLAIWFMSGTTATGVGLGTVNPVWSIAATGDFNGDGKGDILWRDTSGDIAIWLMNGSSILSSAGLGSLSTVWSVVGTGDFTGNGMSDVLWQDTSGDIAIWFMNGTTVTSVVGLGTIAPPWAIVGTGDFNGDGYADILWRNTSTGALAVWLMNGSTVLQAAGLGSLATTWTVAETGDFNGDGKSDILWHDTSGDVGIWFMNGTTVSSGVGLGTIPPAWSIQGAGVD